MKTIELVEAIDLLRKARPPSARAPSGGVRLWHLADIDFGVQDVRFRGWSGHP